MAATDAGSQARLQEIRTRDVFIRGANRPFEQLTQEDVRARADELRAAVGWGPTVRVAPVAMAWGQLAVAMQRAGAGHRRVRTRPRRLLVKLAPRHGG